MHILVIEDEGRIRRRIIRMVEDYFAEQELTLNYCDSLQEGQDYLQLHAIDLLLLDLNLNGQDGFEVLQKMAARAFHVIIISANHDRALQAFEFGVLDFVPKPFGRQRLYQALARLSVRGLGMGSQLKYLSVQKRDTLKLVDVNQIQYIRGAGIYTELILQNGQQELHNKSLEKLAQLLPDHFFRLHKSYLVDLRRIKQIRVQTGGKYTATLDNDEEIPIGRTRYPKLKELMG